MKGSPSLSRRSFLATTAKAATAALAAPTFMPASVLGRAGLISPSERVTMGFIGIGGQGGGHLLGGAWTYVAGGYAGRKDVQVLAVCDVWRERRERACQQVNDKYAETLGRGKYRACEAYVDFRHILERNDIDAVLIATPAHWHATMAIMAAEAGKDIYCEKPTAVTIDESKAVLNAVRRYGGSTRQARNSEVNMAQNFGRRASSCAAVGSASCAKSTRIVMAVACSGPLALARHRPYL
jgi:hypothetical protein